MKPAMILMETYWSIPGVHGTELHGILSGKDYIPMIPLVID